MVKANRGSKVIECGGIAILLLFAIGFLSKSNAPDWLMASLFILLLLVCFLTVGLYMLKGYRFLRQRLWKSN
jgi:membrane-associated PAP2 superfamily phosphatase